MTMYYVILLGCLVFSGKNYRWSKRYLSYETCVHNRVPTREAYTKSETLFCTVEHFQPVLWTLESAIVKGPTICIETHRTGPMWKESMEARRI